MKVERTDFHSWTIPSPEDLIFLLSSDNGRANIKVRLIPRIISFGAMFKPKRKRQKPRIEWEIKVVRLLSTRAELIQRSEKAAVASSSVILSG